MHHRTDKKFALCLLLVILIMSAIWFIPAQYPAPVRVAAMGGTLAFLGVVVMALPVLRVGPFEWISNLYFEDITRELGQEKAKTSNKEFAELEEQRKFDLFIQNIIGPYMIGIGTFINGISGFF